MPVDSVHATVERYIRKIIIWALSEWTTMLSNARVNPRPFEVVKLEFTDFHNWKKYCKECLPPNTTADSQVLKVSLIRQTFFTKEE